MKLELKHIAPYLPYGLKCQCMGLHVDEYAENPIPVVVEIVGISTEYVEIHEIGRTVTEQYHLSDIFPILHPLSDLTKEITVNEEKFVPIVELAKIAFPKSDSIRINKDGICVIDLICNYDFAYKNGSFECWYLRFTPHCSPCFVQNQLQLFEKLFEWHFDVYNLIENGLAININTLKQ